MIIRNLLLFLLTLSVFNADAMKKKPNLFNLVNMQEYSAHQQATRIALENKIYDSFSDVAERACQTLTFEKLMKFFPLMESFYSIIDPIISKLDESELGEMSIIRQNFLVDMKKLGSLKQSEIEKIDRDFKELREGFALLLKDNCFTDNERYLFEVCFAYEDFLQLQKIYTPLIKKFTREMSKQDQEYIVDFLSNNPNAFVGRIRLLFFPLFLAFPRLYIQYALTNFLYIKMAEEKENILEIFPCIHQLATLPCIIDCITVNPNKGTVKLSERYWLIELASVDGADEVIRSFLGRGFYPDFVDEQGRSALHEAILVGNLKNVAALIEGGASLDIKDQNGDTALDVAAELKDEHQDSLKIYKILKKLSRVDVNIIETGYLSII